MLESVRNCPLPCLHCSAVTPALPRIAGSLPLFLALLRPHPPSLPGTPTHMIWQVSRQSNFTATRSSPGRHDMVFQTFSFPSSLNLPLCTETGLGAEMRPTVGIQDSHWNFGSTQLPLPSLTFRSTGENTLCMWGGPACPDPWPCQHHVPQSCVSTGNRSWGKPHKG